MPLSLNYFILQENYLEVELLGISVLESHFNILENRVVRSRLVEDCRSISDDDRVFFVVTNVVIVDRIDLHAFGVSLSGLVEPVFLVEFVALLLELKGPLQVGFVGLARLHLQLGVVVSPEFELFEAKEKF
jgi:hypothetical protein